MSNEIHDDLFDGHGREPEAEGRPPRRKRGRKILIALLIAFLVLVVGVIAVIALYINGLSRSYDDNVTTMPSTEAFPDEADRPEDSEGTTILLLGSDKRPEGGGELGREGERADSIMLMHIPEDGGEIYVMSVMRDTWVDIPGVGEAKINAAFQHGGMPLMVETLEGHFGTRIDEVMAVDFEGFEGLVDALGGVTVDVPESFTTRHGEVYEAGPTKMDGETALTFSRERYSFADGDYTRVQNQRAFIQALLDRFLEPEVLANPGRISDIVGTISPYLTVSDGLDSGYIRGLVPKMVGVQRSDIHMFTVPTNGVGTSDDGQSVVLPDEQAMQEIGDAIDEGTLDEHYQQLAADDGSGL